MTNLPTTIWPSSSSHQSAFCYALMSPRPSSTARSASLRLSLGRRHMPNGNALEEGSAEYSYRLREQDDEFCRRLRIAIEKGSEFCPTIVNTKPGTSRPIFNYKRP